MLKNVAIMFTANRRSKTEEKHIFRSTQFWNCIQGKIESIYIYIIVVL